ncbi:hypothetical protein GCM10012275_47940 [Longimycelium tulufanense]|uniref:Lysozyme n=1 Tax=Longimycelium tulufanense TaxID=907463 RepID=A0A8J3CJI3_9PSEU|nr:hypothetical protein GCM10012275_47940 [Longimycelium tulufanense]
MKAGAAAAGLFALGPIRTAAAEPGPRGIDVSSHQGRPDWTAVSGAGIEFVYVKATEGHSWTSPTLDDQYAGARGAGLVTGLYHFARPDSGGDPVREADHFADHVYRLDAHYFGALPPCLDIERVGKDLRDWCGRFLDRLRYRLDTYPVLVYASTNFIRDHLSGSWADTHDVSWWVANYGGGPGKFSSPTERVVMHQYTSSGKVPGIKGRVDMNLALFPLHGLTL